jgi:hypothetical protein
MLWCNLTRKKYCGMREQCIEVTTSKATEPGAEISYAKDKLKL